MSPLALLLPLLCGFATPPLLSQDAGRALTQDAGRVISDDALRVVTDDPALGEEIARAARRYVRGPIQVDKTGDKAGDKSGDKSADKPAGVLRPSAGGSDAAGEQTAVLRVQRAGGVAASERWDLVLTMGRTRVAHRTITVHGAATRFDLAEAVAIGLPDMLAGLSNSSAAKPPSATSSGPGSRPVLAAPNPTGVGAPVRRAVLRMVSSRGALPESAPRRPALAEPRLVNGGDGHANPETRSQPAPAPAPAPVAISAAPAPAAEPQPRSMGESAAELGSQSPAAATGGAANVTPAREPGAPSEKPPAAKAAASSAASPPLALQPKPQDLSRDSARVRTPAGAIVLTVSGAVGLFAGIATGSAALLAARQVDSPIGGRFDAELDRRGRALDTASVVLDAVGGAALIAGGSWLIYHVVKTRRAAPTLVPLSGGAAVSFTGAF